MKCRYCGINFECSIYCKDAYDKGLCECFNCYIIRQASNHNTIIEYKRTIENYKNICKWKGQELVSIKEIESIFIANEI
jgi:hypothetical protein